MITKIGVTAGEIWAALEPSKELSVRALSGFLERDSEMVLMAAGWLCREGYCNAVMKNEDIMISLRQQNETNKN